MIKTFEVLMLADGSWTGAGIDKNQNYLEEMDTLINKYLEDNKINISRVTYCTINKNIQHGPSEHNTQRNIYFLATIYF